MVNKKVIYNANIIYRVEEQLEAMSGSLVFTTLDLMKGYHQIKLAEGSKEIMAFTTPWEHYNGRYSL